MPGSRRRCAAPPCGTRSRTSSHASGLGLSGGQQQRLCIARTVAVKPEVILFDEPCSALDPISTAKIEELIDELKKDYTIVIVTHNMQQAARVSDFTAFMYLGELVEFGVTETIFTTPRRQAHAGLHHRPVRLTRPERDGDEHGGTHRSSASTRSWSGSAPRSTRWAAWPRASSRNRWWRCASATPMRAEQVIADDAAGRCARCRRAGADGEAAGAAPADGGRSARSSCRRSRSPRRWSASATTPRTSPSARIVLTQGTPPISAVTGIDRLGRLVRTALKDVLDAFAARRRRQGARRVEARRGDRRDLHRPVPRAPDLHDGGSAHHHGVHASAVHGQEHRARRRPCHQHRRAGELPRRPATASTRRGPRAAARSTPRGTRHEHGQHRHDPPRHPDLVDQAARADRRGRDGAGRAAALQPRAAGFRVVGRR